MIFNINANGEQLKVNLNRKTVSSVNPKRVLYILEDEEFESIKAKLNSIVESVVTEAMNK